MPDPALNDQNELALQVRGLGVDYGSGPVLSELDLDIPAASFSAVLGASGCGKSTLLRSVAGFVRPNSGSIALGGRIVAENGREVVPAEDRGLGMVFQDYALFPHLSVSNNVAFGLRGLGRDARSARVTELLDLVALSDFSERSPAELSGGQQQRVALARALAPRPRLVLLDEPFANLDASLRRELAAEIAEVLKREKAAALMVTHDRDEALAIADEIAVLGPASKGPSLRQRGAPREVYREPLSAEVAALVGDGLICEGIPVTANQGRRIRTVFGDLDAAVRNEASERSLVLLRPEDLSFVETSDDAMVRVIHRRFCGAHWVLTLTATKEQAEGAVAATAKAESIWSEGEPPAIGTTGRLETRRPLWSWTR